jgi:hypothetical protein
MIARRRADGGVERDESSTKLWLGVLVFPWACQGVITFHVNPKYFLFHLSHRIFKRMYGVLNVGKKNN